MSVQQLSIDYGKPTPSGRVLLTVRLGEDLLLCEQVHITNAEKRREFAEKIHGKVTGRHRKDAGAAISVEDVEEYLLKQSAELHHNIIDPPQRADDGSREDLLAKLDETTREQLDRTDVGVIREAEKMLREPDLVQRIVNDIHAVGVVGEEELATAAYLIGTSRLLQKPLAGIVRSLSSSGKSFVIDKVSRLFPAEAVIRASDMSQQALYYMPPGALMHRFIVGGERSRLENDETAEKSRAWRELLEAGELHKVVTVPKPAGVSETTQIHQYGPVAFIESTTLATIFDEDANRCLLLHTDETPEQTLAVIQAIAAGAASEVIPSDREAILLRHHTLQRMLYRVTVEIPYAAEIAAQMPYQQPQARRAINHLLNTLRAVAALHQYQRLDEPYHGAIITASVEDFEVARSILIGPLGESLGNDLAPAVANFGARLFERYGYDSFTTTKAAQEDGTLNTPSKAREYLKPLCAAGVVELVEAGRGPVPHTYKHTGRRAGNGATWLENISLSIPGKASGQVCDIPEYRGSDAAIADLPVPKSSGRLWDAYGDDATRPDPSRRTRGALSYFSETTYVKSGEQSAEVETEEKNARCPSTSAEPTDRERRIIEHFEGSPLDGDIPF